MMAQRRLYATSSGTWAALGRSCDSAWMEAAISPAKYTLFQVLGYYFIQATGQLDVPPIITAPYAARTGCFAGIALGAYYFSLLSWRDHSKFQDLSDFGISAAFSTLFREMAYTTIASVIGASVHGLDDRAGLLSIALFGVLGPAVFLIMLFGSLGIIIAASWSFERLKDRLTRR